MTGKSPGRLEYLFTTPKGLLLGAAGILSIMAAVWATLSGPMVDWGVRDITVNLLSMDLVQAEREGRLIMLFHSCHEFIHPDPVCFFLKARSVSYILTTLGI